jgi:hypothetical protein
MYWYGTLVVPPEIELKGQLVVSQLGPVSDCPFVVRRGDSRIGRDARLNILRNIVSI